MGYYVGDVPAQDLVIDPYRADEIIELDPFSAAEVTLYNSQGAPVDVVGFAAFINYDDNLIVVEWPETTPFETAGIYELRIAVSNDVSGVSEMIPPVRLAVNEFDGWHTLDSARGDWQDAPGFDPWLFELLEIARQQVTAYAPALSVGTQPPAAYRQAQLSQARNIWNSTKVDAASGSMGDETFVIRPYPLDWMIKQILRPKTGMPVIG